MNDFINGFTEELEKLAVKEEYTVEYGTPESEEERRAVQGARARRLAAMLVPTGAVMGFGTGIPMGRKGGAIGAGLGALSGLAMAGLPYLSTTRHVSVMKDPSGAHRSAFERAITPDVYVGPEGEEHPII